MRSVASLTIVASLAALGVNAAPAAVVARDASTNLFAGGLPDWLKSWTGAGCRDNCRGYWGWPGRVMGGDPWGHVVQPGQPSSVPYSSIIIETSTTAAASSSIAIPTSATTDTPIITSTTPEPTFSSTSTSTSSTISSSTSAFAVKDISTSVPETSTSEAPASTPETTAAPSTTEQPQQPTTTEQAPPPPPTTTTTQAAAAPPSPSDSSSSSGAVSDGDIALYLAGHNTIRAQHGAAALTWNNDLSAAAQTWANKCVFEHSGGSLGPFGENLAAGTGDFSITSAVKAWTDEASSYDPSNPQPSHFTQVVWKATTQVGCAVASCNGIFDASFGPAQFYVCEYSPAGNVIGAFAQNVQA